MLSLLKQSIEFYKLAQQDIWTEKDKEIYEAEKKAAPGYSRIYLIIESIAHFIDAPFFEFDKWGQILTDKMWGINLAQFIDIIGVLERSKVGEYISYICKNLIDDHIENLLNDMTDRDFIENVETIIRQGGLSETYQRKLKAAIVKRIIENYNSEDTSKRERAVFVIEKMIEYPVLFNRDFIIQLTKHLGPTAYNKVLTETTGSPQMDAEDILQDKLQTNKKIDIHDLHFILSNITFYPIMFLEMLEKLTDRAKEYIRQFLYVSVNLPIDETNTFMLDENFKPINGNYVNISFPTSFKAIDDWGIMNEDMKNKWYQIFQNFKIIPIQ